MDNFLEILVENVDNLQILNLLEEMIDSIPLIEKNKLLENKNNKFIFIIVLNKILKNKKKKILLEKLENFLKDQNYDSKSSVLLFSYFIQKLNIYFIEKNEKEFFQSLNLFHFNLRINIEIVPGLFSFFLKNINCEFFQSQKILISIYKNFEKIIKRFFSENKNSFININKFVTEKQLLDLLTIKELNKKFEIKSLKNSKYQNLKNSEKKEIERFILFFENFGDKIENLTQNIQKLKYNKKTISQSIKFFITLANLINFYCPNYKRILDISLNMVFKLVQISLKKYEIVLISRKIKKKIKFGRNKNLVDFILNKYHFFIDKIFLKKQFCLEDVQIVNYIQEINFKKINFNFDEKKNLFQKIKNFLELNFITKKIVENEIYFFYKYLNLSFKDVSEIICKIENDLIFLIFDYSKVFNLNKKTKKIALKFILFFIIKNKLYFLNELILKLEQMIMKHENNFDYNKFLFLLSLTSFLLFKKFKDFENEKSKLFYLYSLIVLINKKDFFFDNLSPIIERNINFIIKTLVNYIQTKLVKYYNFIYKKFSDQLIYRILSNIKDIKKINRSSIFLILTIFYKEIPLKKKKSKTQKFNFIEKIFGKYWNDFFYILQMKIEEKCNFVLNFCTNFLSLINLNNNTFLNFSKFLNLYDFYYIFSSSFKNKKIKIFQTYLKFTQEILIFLSNNLNLFEKLKNYFIQDKDPKKYPSNFFRRVIIQLFYQSNNFFSEKFEIISEAIFTLRLSIPLLFNEENIRENSELFLSENDEQNIKVVNSFGSLIFELREIIESFFFLYPVYILESNCFLKEYFYAKEGYNQEIKSQEKIKKLKFFCLDRKNEFFKVLQEFKKVFWKSKWGNVNIMIKNSPYFRILQEIIFLFKEICLIDKSVLFCFKDLKTELLGVFIIFVFFDENLYQINKLKFIIDLLDVLEKKELIDKIKFFFPTLIKKIDSGLKNRNMITSFISEIKIRLKTFN